MLSAMLPGSVVACFVGVGGVLRLFEVLASLLVGARYSGFLGPTGLVRLLL